jgi:hypothetical protein
MEIVQSNAFATPVSMAPATLAARRDQLDSMAEVQVLELATSGSKLV